MKSGSVWVVQPPKQFQTRLQVILHSHWAISWLIVLHIKGQWRIPWRKKLIKRFLQEIIWHIILIDDKSHNEISLLKSVPVRRRCIKSTLSTHQFPILSLCSTRTVKFPTQNIVAQHQTIHHLRGRSYSMLLMDQ
jgi:hypothetical protein